MDLTSFAKEVGTTDPVTVTGLGTRGGPVPDARLVHAPVGIDWIQPAEMTVSVGAGTPVDELDAALAEYGQRVAVPAGGTVGGALAVGRSGIRRLGWGPIRDAVLQVRYVSAAGDVVKGGGPTVKNVSGFDLPRLLVGSWGTLGFLGDMILRTRPRARCERWFAGAVDLSELLVRLYRPTSVLWDGTTTWVLLEGDERDVEAQVAPLDLVPVDGPPPLPDGGRWSIAPGDVPAMTGRFVAEVGVGVVHHSSPAPPRSPDPAVVELHRRLKNRFDLTGRLNPGVDPLSALRPYVDGPPGDPVAVWTLARRACAAWSLPEPELLRIGMNGIFVVGEAVVRVGRVTGSAAAAIALAELLDKAGVRVPAPARPDAVSDGPLTATAWERLALVDDEADWREVGRMVAAVHSLPAEAVPDGYPMPPPESFPWWQFDSLVAEVDDLLDPPARDGIVATIERHRDWTGGVERVVSHGDVHPGNVVMTAEGPFLLDWDLMCWAPAGWDHAMLLRLPRWEYPASWYDEFAAGYGRSLADDPTAIALSELRLVAATLMRLRAGRADRAAMAEAQRRLPFWRGDPDAPMWTAQ